MVFIIVIMPFILLINKIDQDQIYQLHTDVKKTEQQDLNN